MTENVTTDVVLLPCPFCGDDAIKQVVNNELDNPCCVISCGHCGSRGPLRRLEREYTEALAAWNRRLAPPDAVEALPCDVKLPPSTTIGKGCPTSTLMIALKMRVGKNVTFRPVQYAEHHATGNPDAVVEALRGLVLVCGSSGNSVADFDEQAEVFRRETGHTRPGKDIGAAAAPELDQRTRLEIFDAWVKSKIEAARAALALAGVKPE